MIRIFETEAAARKYFGEEVAVEQCECCGEWSASAADHDDGAIIGPTLGDDGLNLYDRLCYECEASLDDDNQPDPA